MPSSPFLELAGLQASVDRVVYKPQMEAPEERPYPFLYFITIRNDSPEAVTLKGRKWIITDAHNQRVVMECDGVMGKFPRLEPGESFAFNHYHVVSCDSRAEGALFGVTESGEPVFARIREFQMRVPK